MVTRSDIRQLTSEEIGAAQEWYKHHQTMVESILCETTETISPGGEDAPKPDLWKSIHWKWFSDQGHLENLREQEVKKPVPVSIWW